jgi:hypothetical protein
LTPEEEHAWWQQLNAKEQGAWETFDQTWEAWHQSKPDDKSPSLPNLEKDILQRHKQLYRNGNPQRTKHIVTCEDCEETNDGSHSRTEADSGTLV